MYKIGLMGCGSVADFGHCPAIEKEPNLVLHSVFDPHFERALQYQQKFHARHAFMNPTYFFESGIDALSITSPAPSHRENTILAASYGLPVLCEKPLAMDDDEAEHMIQVMEEANLPLAVGFCYRFSPVALKIKQLVAEGAIGEVRGLRLIYIWNLHGIYESDGNGHQVYSPRRAERMEEGGPMVDCGVHQIDLARWWLQSEVVDYHGEGAWIENYPAPDHMYLHLRHENGALTTVETSFSYTHTAKHPLSHFTYQLIGTEGMIRYDRESGIFEVRRTDETISLPWSYEKNFDGMYEEWAKVLATGQMGHMPTGRDGLIATKIARTATEEVIRRRPKSIPIIDTFSQAVGLQLLKSN